MTALAASVRGLTTRFGRAIVHRDVDLDVRRGEVLALVGGSGSGKTTLLRQMLGLDRPAAGSIDLLGEPLAQLDRRAAAALRRRTGVLFQHGALFSALTVHDNVALPLRELRLFDEATVRDLVLLKLDLVDLEPRHATKTPAELSGGMVKRVALARALALDPELLFLDEPTAGLDPDRADSFVRLIGRLRRELGLTVVMVSHDLDTVVALADRVAVLAGRRIVALGTLDEVLGVTHPFIDSFFAGERGRRARERQGAAAVTGAVVKES